MTKQPLDWSPEEEKIRQAINKKFKLGLKKKCAIRIWEKVQSSLAEQRGCSVDDVTQDIVARYFHLARPDVTKGLNHGSLSLENLIVILTQLEWSWGDLPDLPDLEARCIAGYQEAVLWVSAEVLTQRDATMITRDIFLSLCPVVQDFKYLEHEANETLDDEAWEEILQRLLPTIANRLGVSVATLPYRTAPQFDLLRKQWGEAVSRCLQAILYDWLESDP